MTNPTLIQLRNAPNQLPRLPGPKHDRLHMAEGLKSCWCMCRKCFQRYSTGGICICRECPCAAAYNATLPMYVPYRPVGD